MAQGQARAKIDGREDTPLRWPDGWPRTRFQDRETRPAWKKTYAQAVESLVRELQRLGATSYLLTRNLAQTEDSGIAVYFTLQPVNQYGWQEALGFIGEIPTVQQIDRAYMDKIRSTGCHSDGPKPDMALFVSLTEHRDRARAWARGEQTVVHDKVMALDAFREQRWNVNAVRLTIAAMRQIERCGSPVMMERAWRGFSKAIGAGTPEATA
jgi:hypothetical protein